MYETNLKSVTSHPLEPPPSQIVTPSRTPPPQARRTLWTAPKKIIRIRCPERFYA